MFDDRTKVSIGLHNGNSFDALVTQEDLDSILNAVKDNMDDPNSIDSCGYMAIVSTDNGKTKKRLIRLSSIDEICY